MADSQQCVAAGIQRSPGAVGSCSDNALAENFFARLECELLPRAQWADLAEAEVEELWLYMEGFYNRRRHAALG